MALKPTLYKAIVNVVDMNRNIYGTEKLMLVLHPSETETRMMVRLLAFVLNYDADLSFSKGLSTADEPDLWIVRPDGSVACWIEVGQASPERLRKAVSRAEQVRLYAYGAETEVWWSKYAEVITGLPKTQVFQFPAKQVALLSMLCGRNMEITVTISENQVFVSSGEQQQELDFKQLTTA